MSEQPVGEWPDVPARSGVEVVLGAADQVTATAQLAERLQAAVDELGRLCVRKQLIRRADILDILDRHGVA